MSKQVVQFILFLVVFSMLGFFGYFYYIKPQREYIKINTQDCISKAMAPINSEVIKDAPDQYTTRTGFTVMQKKQTNELNSCLENYNTILFSSPESDLLLLNINSSVDSQSDEIEAYIKRVEDKQAAIKAANDARIAEQVRSQNAQQAAIQQQNYQKQMCANMKAEQDKLTACMQAAMADPGMNSAAYLLAISQETNKRKACDLKYDPNKFGVTITDCIYAGIWK